MRTVRITISLSQDLLHKLDGLVKSHVFLSRSQAVQEAVEEKIRRLYRTRLEQECSKLDPVEEQAFADLGLTSDEGEWPPF